MRGATGPVCVPTTATAYPVVNGAEEHVERGDRATHRIDRAVDLEGLLDLPHLVLGRRRDRPGAVVAVASRPGGAGSGT